MKFSRQCCACCAALAALGLFATAAHAVTTNWTNNSGGSFTVTGNWDSGVPDSNDTAVFRRGRVSPYDVSFVNPIPPPLGSAIHPTINNLVVGTNEVTFFSFVPSTLTVDAFIGVGGITTIGDTATDVAELNMLLSDLTTLSATLGSAAGSSGIFNLGGGRTFHVNGTGATFNLNVGFSGTGAINVSGGADVVVTDDVALGRNASGVGTVTVSGNGSTWTNDLMYVGHAGQGTLNVNSDADVTTTTGSIGDGSGSIGDVNVTGNGTKWTNSGNLYVGFDGQASLDITGGADVFTNAGYVGTHDSSTGQITVSGAGSNFSITAGRLYVGHEGYGSLDVTTGGVVATGVSYVGNAAGSMGEVTVNGMGSAWTCVNLLFVGYMGDGTLDVINKGQVTSPGGIIGAESGSIGTVIVDGAGSLWNNSGDLTVAQFSQETVDQRTSLTIEAGGLVLNSNGLIGEKMGSSGIVTVTGKDEEGNRSTWNNTLNLTIGNEGKGTLKVENGGSVSNAFGFIALGDGSTGSDATVTGAESTWTNTSLRVGGNSMGTLDILNGGAVTDDVGKVVQGTVTVAGADLDGNPSKWTNDELDVGSTNNRQGNLIIEAGGSVSALFSNIGSDAGSIGTATVTGTGSTWTSVMFLRVGDSGTGTLTIEEGGNVSSDGDGYVGNNLGSVGDATVKGEGSAWTIDEELHVGHFSADDNKLTIKNGGMVTNDNGSIGHNAGSQGTVTVTDATWTNSMDLFVGNEGKGTLNINAGGMVSNVAGFIGNNAGSDGTAVVTGADAVWTNSGNLRVGNAGMGTLDILAGGAVSNNHGLIGALADSIGTATASGAGSTWMTSGRLSIGGDAAAATNGGTGTLRIQAGAAVGVAQDIVLFPNGLLDFEGGTLSTMAVRFQGGGAFDWTGGTLHVDVFDGNLVNKGGTLAPGESAGSTAIIGNYTQQAAGTLQAEIGGTVINTQYDFVNVTGNAFLGGELQLALINGFVPNATDTFTVFSADNLLNFFSNVTNAQRLTTTDGMGSFIVHYGPTSMFNPDQVVLTSFELVALPGDYNQNGVVDAADYTIWRDTLGSTTDLRADGNGNGEITQLDYDFWKLHFGETAGSGSALPSAESLSAAVPEPATMGLLMAAAASLSLRRKFLQLI